MKRLFNAAAFGLLGSFVLFHPGFAADTPAQDNTVQVGAPEPPKPGTVSTTLPEITQGISFYVNVLETADKLHFNGKATADLNEMTKDALHAVFDQVFRERIFNTVTGTFDKDAVTFSGTGNDRHVESLTINGRKITLEAPAIPLTSYEEQGRYLQAPIEALSKETGISIRRLFEHAVNGALHSSRDPHTSFLGEDAVRAMMQSTRGEFIGIGLQMRSEGGKVFVDAPMAGGPAEKAGLKSGDRIVSVDGKPVDNMKLHEVSKLIIGDEGTEVVLTIERANEKPFDMAIERARIEIDAVKGRLVGPDKDTAHFEISTFSEKTAQDLFDTFKELIDEAKKDGKGIAAIILDFRDNPGGLLSQAKIISDLFLAQEEGEDPLPIVAVGKNAQEGQVFADTVVNINISGCPVIVLQNQGSASASEIVAGALQDGGFPVVGSRSFGKGSVQRLVELNSRGKLPSPMQQMIGFEPGGMLKITTDAFFPGASGLSNQGSGIIPNVKVVYNDVRDEMERNASREADLQHSLLSKEKTREGQEPDLICTLKPEYAGPLSDETAAKLPPELVQTLSIYDEKAKEWKTQKFFDADLGAAIFLLEGKSPYMTMELNEAASNDNDPAVDDEKAPEAAPVAPRVAAPAP